MTLPVSGHTRLAAVIGSPVRHSLSPAIHNAAFAATGLDWVYLAFEVRPEQLGSAVEGLRALRMRGANVTVPHKEAVMGLLDMVDPVASRIGAVNTIVNKEGWLFGYNTDVKAGDTILFGKYSGNEIKLDDEEFLILREEEVLGVIEGAAKSAKK